MLLTRAHALAGVDAGMAGALSADVIDGIVELIPESWLEDGAPDRATYPRYLVDRLAPPRAFVEEAIRAR